MYGKNDACLAIFKYEQCQYLQNVIKSGIEIALEGEKAWLEKEKIELIDQMKFTIEKGLEEEKSQFEKEKKIFVDQIRDIKSQVNGLKLELKQTKLKYYTNNKKPHNNKRNGSSSVKNELTEPSSSKLYDVHKWKYPVNYEQLGITNVRNNCIFLDINSFAVQEKGDLQDLVNSLSGLDASADVINDLSDSVPDL